MLDFLNLSEQAQNKAAGTTSAHIGSSESFQARRYAYSWLTRLHIKVGCVHGQWLHEAAAE
jgi:hypothetical protein